MSVDLSAPMLAAIRGQSSITDLLPAYAGNYPIFTRRPVPNDAPYPMIVVSQDITSVDEDGINDRRPMQTRDVAVYGQNDTAADYRTVEQLAYLLQNFFHRNKKSISVPGWGVVNITASGPVAGPTDDLTKVARIVPVTVHLAAPALFP